MFRIVNIAIWLLSTLMLQTNGQCDYSCRRCDRNQEACDKDPDCQFLTGIQINPSIGLNSICVSVGSCDSDCTLCPDTVRDCIFGSYTNCDIAGDGPNRGTCVPQPAPSPTNNPWPTIRPISPQLQLQLTTSPTIRRTTGPTEQPTPSPTSSPTSSPESSPTLSPESSPTSLPSRGPTKNPTSLPSIKPTAGPTMEPTEIPTVIPTEIPTIEPTPKPSAEPTKSPTSLPTRGPTENPTPGPTSGPTSSPTSLPTDAPSQGPTSEPTTSPTPIPTLTPTMPPIMQQVCSDTLEEDDRYDLIMLYDNSCGLNENECDELLEGVGELAASFIDDDDTNTRVQTMEFNADGTVRVIVAFNQDVLQNDAYEYVNFVRIYGECMSGGDGETDIATALNTAITYFDQDDDDEDDDDDVIKKVITISACSDTTGADLHRKYCDSALKKKYDNEGVDLYAINVPNVGNATNQIDLTTALTNLRCISDSRVCVTSDTIDSSDFLYVVEDCLLPHICSSRTKVTTNEPTTPAPTTPAPTTPVPTTPVPTTPVPTTPAPTTPAPTTPAPTSPAPTTPAPTTPAPTTPAPTTPAPTTPAPTTPVPTTISPTSTSSTTAPIIIPIIRAATTTASTTELSKTVNPWPTPAPPTPCPTTLAQTTPAPTTPAPTTPAPTTPAPTTPAPTTPAPTTPAPTTPAPTTPAPTTPAPTTPAPTTPAPTTPAPTIPKNTTTIAPTTAAPTTRSPTNPPAPISRNCDCRRGIVSISLRYIGDETGTVTVTGGRYGGDVYGSFNVIQGDVITVNSMDIGHTKFQSTLGIILKDTEGYTACKGRIRRCRIGLIGKELPTCRGYLRYDSFTCTDGSICDSIAVASRESSY